MASMRAAIRENRFDAFRRELKAGQGGASARV
jgi:hypothetical protein